jgi:integrase
VRQYFEEWLAAIKISVKPTTYSNYRGYAEYNVIPIIGDRRLQDLTTETINLLYAHLLEKGRRRGNSNQLMHEEWKRSIARGQQATPRQLSSAGAVSYAAGVRALAGFRAGRIPAEFSPGLDPRSVQSIHIMLNRALNDAVKWKYLVDNPVRHAVRIKRPQRGHRVWTPDELRRFLAAARADRLHGMWLLFATTGIRRSEAAGAGSGDVDLTARTLTVWQTRVVAGGRAQTSDGKTKRSRRTLALDNHTVDVLAGHLQTLEEERAAFGPDYDEHRLLFCWPDGRPLHSDTITKQFNRLVDRAGVPPITLHDVRHIYATMSLRAGVNPKIVSARLGHATVAFTLDTYTEDVPELHHAARRDGQPSLPRPAIRRRRCTASGRTPSTTRFRPPARQPLLGYGPVRI